LPHHQFRVFRSVRTDPIAIIFALVLASTVLPLLPSIASAASPPIDCRKAASAVDREICGSPEFLAMDREITALYDRGMSQFSGEDRHRLAVSQQTFLRQRAGCGWAAHHSAHPGVAVEECVRNTMDGRVHALRLVVDRGRF
jgi:uncharacterized protein YecT (DUF1311 family)